MSTADSVNTIPPTEALLAIVQKYENDVRQTADAQTNSTTITKLDLPSVCEQVEEEFKSHREKVIPEKNKL
jgi:hypothetical protein